MAIGKDYVEDFIMGAGNKNATGAYLEYHDVPHFHCPCNAQAAGFLTLGMLDEQSSTMKLAAFTIPFGKAVYMR